MGKQFIVSVSREYGSGGNEIATVLAERFNIKMYDRSIIDEISAHLNVDPETLKQYDERPKNFFATRRVGKHSSSMEDALVEMEFDFIRKKAESGESFVIVGRCSDWVLKDHPGLVTIFISGDEEHKVERIMQRRNLSKPDAAEAVKRIDKKRKWYHNRYSDIKWGDSRHYDICINSAVGVEATSDVLEEYINKKISL